MKLRGRKFLCKAARKKLANDYNKLYLQVVFRMMNNDEVIVSVLFY